MFIVDTTSLDSRRSIVKTINRKRKEKYKRINKKVSLKLSLLGYKTKTTQKLEGKEKS